MGIINRFKSGWDAFRGRHPTDNNDPTVTYSFTPDKPRLSGGYNRTIINTIYTKLSVDVASITMRHAIVNDDKQFVKSVEKSNLDYLLNRKANADQTSREFIQDVALTMFEEGVAAIVPVNTDVDPISNEEFKINELRVGSVKEWKVNSVTVEVYNSLTGIRELVNLPKRIVALAYNPFYQIMNDSNSISRRLISVLSDIDLQNSKNNPGKLDIIIQLPYSTRSELRQKEAEKRRANIEQQLNNSQMGIAYIDGTEKITQLNRSLENNLLQQAKDLTDQLFNQLGFTKSIFDGTANEAEMLNYYNRTILPIVSAISESMEVKYLTDADVYKRHEAIYCHRSVFKLVPVNDLAEIADKFTRNEILTSNEIRAIIGMRPSDDPKANELINSNIAYEQYEGDPQDYDFDLEEKDYESMTDEELEAELRRIDEMEKELNG